jgi:hypothetical protein
MTIIIEVKRKIYRESSAQREFSLNQKAGETRRKITQQKKLRETEKKRNKKSSKINLEEREINRCTEKETLKVH